MGHFSDRIGIRNVTIRGVTQDWRYQRPRMKLCTFDKLQGLDVVDFQCVRCEDDNLLGEIRMSGECQPVKQNTHMEIEPLDS